ncbi:MAG: type II toxin-antitoxin system PrlF family antitoxin [Leptospira sp.]|nr:type II toxin-antitoxin system PrlF family antitoxin [Leptospira sp.]
MSTVTEKYQATIPKRIREKLGLSKGDKLAFEVIEDRVWIRKLMATDIEYLTALNGTMSEWSSIEDNEAYSDF